MDLVQYLHPVLCVAGGFDVIKLQFNVIFEHKPCNLVEIFVRLYVRNQSAIAMSNLMAIC